MLCYSDINPKCKAGVILNILHFGKPLSSIDCYFKYVDGKTEPFGPYHFHDHYEIFFTITDNVKHLVNDHLQELNMGALVFVRPDDSHSFIYNGEENYRFINLTFRKSVIENLFSYLSNTSFDPASLLSPKYSPIVYLNAIEQKNFVTKLERFNVNPWSDEKNTNLLLRSFLLNMFEKYFSDMESARKKAVMPDWLEDTCYKMKTRENFSGGIPRMIEISGVSREHLARTLKKYTGLTMADYINDLRVNYAANMLFQSNIPIIDICFDCGFQNIGYFYKLFKDKFGISPKQFRLENVPWF